MTELPDDTRVSSVPRLARRAPDAHKGTFGRVLVVAGSRGMSGAACLAGMGALRGGAGLVRVATAHGAWSVVAAYEPSYLTAALADDASGHISVAAADEIVALACANDVVALGPGLGAGAFDMVRCVLPALSKPVVLDADGLNALVGHLDALDRRNSPTVLTPHPGEFARLLSISTRDVAAAREMLAAEFARAHRVVLLLKGHRSLVSDGVRVYRNTTGNPGMATGGAGDVLTGLIAAFIAQQLSPFDAAVLGAHVHGLAGDLAAQALGQTALIASDLARFLAPALRTVEE
jgi:NAD(P)H-hydrate epimerase